MSTAAAATVTSTEASIAPPRNPQRAAVRRDIQWLRALAVATVVVYHFWPEVLTGGFVGVDVFFVISGYLITSHLIERAERDGRVSFGEFWARRVRRLLPASLLVLLLSSLAVFAWVPPSVREQAFREISAATVYIENWVLAADSVDYLAATNTPSLVQHYWSLSVEEQFYIVWPLLIALTLVIAKLLRRASRTAIVITILAVAAASLTWSIIETTNDPSVAYFSTFSRAWEFAIGALVATVPWLASGPDRLSATWMRWVMRAAGFAAIAYAAVVYTGEAFPGWIALIPVLGTALVIFAGIGRERTSLRTDPIEYLGDRSYAIYLWHWPLLIVAPAVIGGELELWQKLILLVITVVLADLTKRLVEDPARRWRRIAVPWRTFVAGGAAMLVVLAVAVPGLASYAAPPPPAPTPTVRPTLAPVNCRGYEAIERSCRDAYDADGADTAFARNDRPATCIDKPTAPYVACTYGSGSRVAAMVGDSHAASIVELIAESLPSDWRLVTAFANGCASISRDLVGAKGQATSDMENCAAWSNARLDEILADPEIEAVIFTNFTSAYLDPSMPAESHLTAAKADATFAEMERAGKQVIVISDVPIPTAGDIPLCVDAEAELYDPCATSRLEATLEDDPMGDAAIARGRPFLGLADAFCDPLECHAVIGGIVAYSDAHHAANTYVRTMVPYVEEWLADALSLTDLAREVRTTRGR